MTTKQEVIDAIDYTIKALEEIRLNVITGVIPPKEYFALMKDLEGG